MACILQNKTVLLGVTGSIAAFKAASLASQLVQGGAQVDVVMTRAAQAFVGKLTFEAITRRRAVTDVLELLPSAEIGHVAMAKRAAVFVIAPVTANTLAKLAHGFADDAVCATALDTRAPLILAPAMETGMWEHPATQENLKRLVGRGAIVVEPTIGHLASGARGKGRLAEPDEIVDVIRAVLGRGGDLAGKKVVVTAGGTQEALDPVRVLTNHSSGKMGFALAQAARDRGARVTLIVGTTSLRVPRGLDCVHALSALEMRDAVLRAIPDADALIMAAAVADFRSATPAEAKIKKGQSPTLTLELMNNPDILSEVADWREKNRNPKIRPEAGAGSNISNLVVVGFAAETTDLLANAKAKLETKRLDLIVANPVPSSFGSGESQAVLIARGGAATELPPLQKEELAEKILDIVLSCFNRRR